MTPTTPYNVYPPSPQEDTAHLPARIETTNKISCAPPSRSAPSSVPMLVLVYMYTDLLFWASQQRSVCFTGRLFPSYGVLQVPQQNLCLAVMVIVSFHKERASWWVFIVVKVGNNKATVHQLLGGGGSLGTKGQRTYLCCIAPSFFPTYITS